MNTKSSKRVGSIVLATEQGLGILAKSFYDNGIIDDVVIRPHSSRLNHTEWYPYACESVEELLSKIDVLLLFEEAWDWHVIVKAREKGIKTVLMPMYECTRHPLPYQPDLIISPSLLDQRYYPDSTLVTVPVDTSWKLREKALVFVHNAGNGGLGGRNGTKELIEAIPHIKSPIKLIIRTQGSLPIITDPRVEVRGSCKYEDLFSEGDVFVFPEKFNGLSLPLQEAFASGMLVMAGNRFPMNTWLPNDPLIKVDSYRKERIAVEFDSAVINPIDIAETIDKWYNQDITKFSLLGKDWGEKNSWNKLKEVYETLLFA